MQVIVKLNYPSKTEIEPEEVTAQLLAKGYKPSPKVPCSEMSDKFWEELPKPLSRNPFRMEVSESEWISAMDYTPEYYLKDVKGLWDCIQQLQSDSRLEQFSAQQIESGFRRYWNDDERPQYVHYSEEDAIATANAMIEEFVEDCLGSDIQTIKPRDEIAEQVAAATGLEVIVQSQTWVFPRYIDGGEGAGFRVWGA